MRINPFFEVDGKKYEIKSTRHLQVLFEEMTENNGLNDEEKEKSAVAIRMQSEAQELGQRLSVAKEEYFNDITNADKKAKYLAFKELFDNAYDELIKYEAKNKAVDKLQKKVIDIAEQILIEALVEQYGLTKKDAEIVWCSYVDMIGTQKATEWLALMQDCLFNGSEEDDPFLKLAKAKQQENLERRRGLMNTKRK